MVSKAIADQIVKQSMELISINVNIMDRNGVIIASGDERRINTLHEGALLAIQRKEIVLITYDDSRNLRGSKEGVNVPFFRRGLLEGVIGITGNCDEVLKYAQLLKMTTELFLEKELLIEEQTKRKNLKESFFMQLIKNDIEFFNGDIVDIYSKRLLLNNYHAVFIIKFLNQDFIELNYKMTKANKIIGKLDINFSVILDSNSIAIVISDSSKSVLLNKCEDIAKIIVKDFDKNEIDNYKIYIGCIFREQSGINKSYKTAVNLMNIKSPNNFNIFFADDFLLETVINSTQKTPEVDYFVSLWKKILLVDKYNELVDTINVYYEVNSENKLVAQSLNIHRNTLNYRFEKIEKATNLNPKNKKSLFKLIVAQQLYYKYL